MTSEGYIDAPDVHMVTQATLTGTVTDSVTGQVLSNVTIECDSGCSDHQSYTGSGNYSIQHARGSCSFRFSCSGYQARTFNVKLNTETITLDVALTENLDGNVLKY